MKNPECAVSREAGGRTRMEDVMGQRRDKESAG